MAAMNTGVDLGIGTGIGINCVALVVAQLLVLLLLVPHNLPPSWTAVDLRNVYRGIITCGNNPLMPIDHGTTMNYTTKTNISNMYNRRHANLAMALVPPACQKNLFELRKEEEDRRGDMSDPHHLYHFESRIHLEAACGAHCTSKSNCGTNGCIANDCPVNCNFISCASGCSCPSPTGWLNTVLFLIYD